MILGLKLAAIYGLMPNRLGFCGPQTKQEQSLIYNFICGYKKRNFSERKIIEILKKFTGASTYYELIAKSNGIKNIFDFNVVKAYWIGNELLENITIDDLKKTVLEKYIDLGLVSKQIVQDKIRNISNNAKPHHSFNVYVLGAVSGNLIQEEKLLDLCRISWGRIRKILPSKNEKKTVEIIYKPIIKSAKGWKFGLETIKKINWDSKIIRELEVGDWVSIHWNNVSECLNEEDVKNLEKYTLLNINIS